MKRYIVLAVAILLLGGCAKPAAQQETPEVKQQVKGSAVRALIEYHGRGLYSVATYDHQKLEKAAEILRGDHPGEHFKVIRADDLRGRSIFVAPIGGVIIEETQ